MNILDFAINYPDEETCREKFKQQRDQMGVTCPYGKWSINCVT
jgi:hypothetical protein